MRNVGLLYYFLKDVFNKYNCGKNTSYFIDNTDNYM